jgi:membrane-bound lytic murein transglycosylase D
MIAQLDSSTWMYHLKLYKPSRRDTQQLNRFNYEANFVPRPHAAVVEQRLKEICSVVPLDYNPIVQEFIDLYTVRIRGATSRLLGLQYVWFPLFEEVFQRENMPTELKYLAVIESALNPRARSHAGALGLWQFMYGTGVLYGLKADSYMDDRLDPYKSTVAAARHLKDLYKMYNDWHLALAAYNCGPGWVTRAIKLSGKRNFWEIYRYLPIETRGYVPAFIAAAYALNYGSEHNMYPIYVDFNYMNADTAGITGRQLKLDAIAGATGVSLETLKDLNPQLKLGVIPYSTKPFLFRAPHKVIDWLYSRGYARVDTGNLQMVGYDPKEYKNCSWREAEAPGNCTLVYHTLKPSETVYTLAGLYGVRYDNILEWNQMWGSGLQVGQTVKIFKPLNGSESGSNGQASPTGPAPITQPIDNASANGERPSYTPPPPAAKQEAPNPFGHLAPGPPGGGPSQSQAQATYRPPVQTYSAPKPAPKPAAAPANVKGAQYYKVTNGDSLWSISNKFNTSVAQIMQLNGLATSRIYPGQTIRVK